MFAVDFAETADIDFVEDESEFDRVEELSASSSSVLLVEFSNALTSC